MTVTALTPAAGAGARRRRLAACERPLLLVGLALVTAHLLDLSLAGSDTTALGLVGIVALPLAWAWAAPHLIRLTRFALGVVFGLLAVGFGVVSHGLHVVNSGPAWTDVTGIGFLLGGLLLVASGIAALAAPRRPVRRPQPAARAAHAAGWLAGAVAVLVLVCFPVLLGLLTTHAPRWRIDEASLGIPHQEVRIAMADGTELSAWYVPSDNGAAVLLSHGSGGSRARVAAHVRMLARHGYGVLAVDNPGNGESEGRSNGLGYGVQPAVAAAIGWLAGRPDVHEGRIAGFGTSLGGELLLEAAARDRRLRAVVSDGAMRPMDERAVRRPSTLEYAPTWLGLQAARAFSGTRPAPSLLGLVPRIAPRPVLLIASGGDPTEIPANRRYRAAGGDDVQLWAIPEAAHTGGLRTRPAEYERRTTAFLDAALGR